MKLLATVTVSGAGRPPKELADELTRYMAQVREAFPHATVTLLPRPRQVWLIQAWACADMRQAHRIPAENPASARTLPVSAVCLPHTDADAPFGASPPSWGVLRSTPGA